MAITGDPLQLDSSLSAPVDLQEPLLSPLSDPVETASDEIDSLLAVESTALITASQSIDQLDAAINALSGSLSTTETHDPLNGGTGTSAPPLLQAALSQDTFLSYSAPQSPPRQVLEDRPFSLDLAGLLPEGYEPAQLQILDQTDGSAVEWLAYEQRLPDATLTDKLVIEGLFRGATADGVQLDLVVTDTRHDGLGLIGLELDLLWNADAMELEQVQLTPSLPLFRDTGDLDAAAGSLSGLVAAGLPSSGNGEALGDGWRDTFAQLNYRLLSATAADPGLTIIPRNQPARGNTSLSAEEMVVVDSQSQPIPVLFGLAQQAQVGEHQLLLQAIDGEGRPWQQTLVLNILNVNDAPVARPLAPISVLEDAAISINLADAFQDDDLSVGDSLSYQLSAGSPDWLVLDERSGLLSGQSGNSEVGRWQIGIEAQDQSGATARQMLELMVINTNDAPVWSGAALPEIWVRQDRPFEIRLPERSISDGDAGDQLRYSLDLRETPQLASMLTVDAERGIISGLIPAGTTELLNLQLVATDLAGASASVPLQLRVVDQDFNRSPYRIGAELELTTLQEGDRFQLQVDDLFRDDDIPIGDHLHFTVDAPEWLQFDPERNSLSGLADNNSVGRHAIRLQAIDQAGATAEARFWLKVENTNQAPFPLDGAFDERRMRVNSDLWLNAGELFEDLDRIHGDALSFSLQSNRESSLRFNPSTGELRFSPEPADAGLHRLILTATDRSGASSRYQLNLDVITAEQGRDEPQTRPDDNLLSIQPNLYVSGSGERVEPEQLASLPAGSRLTMQVELSDQRQTSLNPGVIGLDLDLRWRGLELIQPQDQPLQASISALFPLFRQVDASRLSDHRLRFSAASLPELGLGEALGDERAEPFLRLDFELGDPSAPIRLDLKLNQESAGGLGLGLADGSSAETELEIKSLSSQTLIDRLMQAGLKQTDQLRQQLQQVVEWLTSQPAITTRPQGPFQLQPVSQTSLQEKREFELPLTRIIKAQEAASLETSAVNFQITMHGRTEAEADQLVKRITINQSSNNPEIIVDHRGLIETLRGDLKIAISSGNLGDSKSFAVVLNPTPEIVNITSNIPTNFDTGGGSVTLGQLLQAEPLVLADDSDVVLLHIQSTQPVKARLTDTFLKLTGISVSEATRLENLWLIQSDMQASNPTSSLTIPVSELLALAAGKADRFDLDWIEITADANSTGTVLLAVSTSTRVQGDDGSRFGIAVSPWLQMRLNVPRLTLEASESTTPGIRRSVRGGAISEPNPSVSSKLLHENRIHRSAPHENHWVNSSSPATVTKHQPEGDPDLEDETEPGASRARPSESNDDQDLEQLTESIQHKRGKETPVPMLHSMLLHLLDAYQHPASLAGLVITLAAMPGGGERSLRSLLLKAKLGRAIHIQRRNLELEAAWLLRLFQPEGSPIDLQLQIHKGQLSLKMDVTCSESRLQVKHDLHPHSTLWQALKSSRNPGERLAEINNLLERVLRHHHDNVNWNKWLDHLMQHCDRSAGNQIRQHLHQLQHTLLLAQSVDEAMGDALMVSELLNCQAQLGLIQSAQSAH